MWRSTFSLMLVHLRMACHPKLTLVMAGVSEGWAHQDSNLEPADYEPAALTIELWAREDGKWQMVYGKASSSCQWPRDRRFSIDHLPFSISGYVRPSRNARSFLERDGWRSFLSALASIWRIRSRVTAKL